MWNNEKLFGKYVMMKLKNVGMTPIRIESASTISGMPDIYAMGRHDYFIELKNMKDKSINSSSWKIEWRPGQQAWAQQYAAAHTVHVGKEFIKTKCSWTFVGLKDGVLLIRMEDYIPDAKVYADNANVFMFTTDEFRILDLFWFLRTHSQVALPILRNNMTWGCFLHNAMQYNLNECELGNHYYDIDYPAPTDFVHELAPYASIELKQAMTSLELADTNTIRWILRKVCEQASSVYESFIDNERIIDKDYQLKLFN